MGRAARDPTWAASGAGAAAIAGVVAWQLATASPRRDVATLCEAETTFRLSLRDDMGAVSERVRSSLMTPRENLFFSAVRDAPVEQRAALLEREAARVGLRRCRLAETYAQVAEEADYRRDVQRLCSYVTFPGLATLDDDMRRRTLSAWMDEEPTSGRARVLAGAIAQAPTAPQAAILLRSAAAEIGVLTCDTAKVLATPAAPACSAP